MPKVSIVIIEDEKSREYICRCLNMLDRQTYSDIEALVETIPDIMANCSMSIGKIHPYGKQDSFWGVLSESIKILSGEYVLFCHPAIVLSPNSVEELVKKIEANSLPTIDSVFSFDCKDVSYGNINIYGKLFDLEILKKVYLTMSESNSTNELLFLVRYYSNIKEENTVSATMYCDTDFDTSPTFKFEDFADSADISMLGSLPEKKKYAVCEYLFSRVNIPESAPKEFYDYLMTVSRSFSEDERFQFLFISRFVKSIYKDAQDGSKEAYRFCKQYVMSLSDKLKFKDALFAEIGLSEKQVECMKLCSFEDYLFWHEKLYEDSDMDIVMLRKDISQIKEEIARNRELIEQSIKVETENDTVRINNLLEGSDLIEYTTKQYTDGKLGFKTIILSIRAWLRHKFHSRRK